MDYPIKNPRQLGQVLQGLRREKGLTQKTAGSKVGLRQAKVSQLESDPGPASVAKLFKFLSALEVDVFVRAKAAAPPRAKKSQSRKVEW
jgi:Helix-turn-helix.